MDLSTLTDPQLRAELDFAAKQYAARAVGEMLDAQPSLTASELHQLLLDQVAEAEAASRR